MAIYDNRYYMKMYDNRLYNNKECFVKHVSFNVSSNTVAVAVLCCKTFAVISNLRCLIFDVI